MVELQFPYYGEIEKLHESLSRNRHHLNLAFNKMYGAEMTRVIGNAEKAYLDENAFAAPGLKTRIGYEETGANSFALAIGSEGETLIRDDGHFTTNAMKVAPFFCFSEEAMGKKRKQYEGWVSPYLGPYVHEYNHFAMFALQGRKPMAAAQMIAMAGITPTRWPLMPQDLIEMVRICEGGLARKLLIAKLAALATMLHFVQENSTRKIDEQIFHHLGLKVPEDYFAPQSDGRGYIPIPIMELGTMVIFPIGDILGNFPPRERIRRLRDWLELGRTSDPTQGNFLESFKQVEIEISSVSHLLRTTTSKLAKNDLLRFMGLDPD